MASLHRDNRTFFGIRDDTWTALALWAIIGFDGINYNINRTINYLMKNPTTLDTAIIGMISAVFILLGTAAAMKKMQRREFLLIVFIGMAWFLSFVFNEDARILLTGTFFAPVFVYGFCGIVCIAQFKNWETFRKVGAVFAIVGIITFIITSALVINEDVRTDYMSFSYANLIFVVTAFWIAIHKNNIFYGIVGVIGMLFIMLVGSRGALLCALIYLLLEFLLSKKMHIAVKILFLAAVVLIYYNLENIMFWLDGFIRQAGYESRTISKFFEGTLQDDSGRKDIFICCLEIIAEHPIFGCGAGGSMSELFEKVNGFPPVKGGQGAYAHNLFLDLYMHFGIFIGTFISLWIIIHLIIAYKKSRKMETYNVLFLFFSIIFPKLMVSDTYLSNPEFFILLGLLLNICYSENEQLPQNKIE